jgi:hypothetical protein
VGWVSFLMASRGTIGFVPSRGAGAFRAAAFVWAACFSLFVTTLSACTGGDGASSFLVDPARYNGYHCQDLADQWKGLLEREKKLRNLIDKASESGGGQVIGAIAYSGDLQTVLEQEKVLKRTAEAQKCQFVATYTSDQTIR